MLFLLLGPAAHSATVLGLIPITPEGPSSVHNFCRQRDWKALQETFCTGAASSEALGRFEAPLLKHN